VPGRRFAVAVALGAAALVVSIVPAGRALAAAPPGLEPFLYALGQVESGGSYTARNEISGAYGKYQILPSNWPGWARLYVGSSTAPQTPTNQEKVAHGKVTALYAWVDSWPVVAHWWLTGSSERNAAYWSSYSRTYVEKVIDLMKKVNGGVAGAVSTTATKTSPTSWIDRSDVRIGDGSTTIRYASGWRTATYSSYTGRRVTYATRAGASASFSFTGNGIAWYGPVGPTRGKARVYIDGKAVATVDLRRDDFAARRLLFARPLSSERHTFKIVVLTSGKPVAIDDLLVGAIRP
jgi:hypothetical protein